MQVRCDSGIMEGQEISIYYDSMICKVRNVKSSVVDVFIGIMEQFDSATSQSIP